MGLTLNPALTRGDAEQSIRRFGYAPRVVGRPVLPPDATEAAWLAMRRTMLTASEVASVLGVDGAYDSPFSLWWKKQPDWPGTEQTAAMHIGRKLESVIGELWAENHPEAGLFRPGAALWSHPSETWLGATPDYLSVWPEPIDPARASIPLLQSLHGRSNTGVYVEPVECKSDEGGPGWGKADTDEVPRHHLIQVVTQCVVLGCRFGRIMRLSGKRLTEYRIDVRNHEDLVAQIINQGRTFHASLETGVAPDIDGHEATTRTLSDLHADIEPGREEMVPDADAEEFRAAKAALKDAKWREQEAVNRIRDRIGRAHAQYAIDADGRRVAARSVYKRQGYTVKPAIIDQIRAVG